MFDGKFIHLGGNFRGSPAATFVCLFALHNVRMIQVVCRAQEALWNDTSQCAKSVRLQPDKGRHSIAQM